MRKISPLLILVSCLAIFPAFCFAQDIDNTPDPVVTLREQIEAAPSAAERNRLRLKLSELLLNTGHNTEALAELSTVSGHLGERGLDQHHRILGNESGYFVQAHFSALPFQLSDKAARTAD